MQKRIDACNKAFERAQKKHDDDTTPLFSELSRIGKTIRRADEARDELFDTCEDESLLDELQELVAQSEGNSGQRHELQSEIRQLERWAEVDKHEASIEM